MPGFSYFQGGNASGGVINWPSKEEDAMECMMSAWDDRNHSVKTTVKYVLRNGQKIYGELLTPEGLSGPFPTVIVSHGFGNTLEISKRLIGEALARSGWAAFCFDFIGGAPVNRSDGSLHRRLPRAGADPARRRGRHRSLGIFGEGCPGL